jgi:1-acyl-sn-glycerol-3-phosphate acyltransferase
VHRYRVQGLEHVPGSGPALVVSPHAFAVLDMFLFAKAVFEGRGRILRGLTDHFAFSIPLVRDLFANLGVVDGTRENGLGLLSSGQLATCMPGGALDWSRSSRERRRLRWGDHRGYARLAVEAGVPVIPTACPAADDLYWIVNDGWRTGRTLRRVLRTSRNYPLPLAIGLGPFPFPVRLTQFVGEPVWPVAEGSLDERARELDLRVLGVLEQLLRRSAP